MPARNNRGAPGALAMLTLFVFLLVAPAARAADLDMPADGTEGWQKVVSYSQCAYMVYRAVTWLDMLAAFASCSKVIMSEPPPPAPAGGL